MGLRVVSRANIKMYSKGKVFVEAIFFFLQFNIVRLSIPTPFKPFHQGAFCLFSRRIFIFYFSLEVGDRTGQITAQMNISDLRSLLGIEDESRET